MFSFETFLLGVALALDAAVASFAIGLLSLEHTHTLKLSRGLLISSVFGFFQFLMLWIGSIGGYFLSFSSMGYLFQFIVAGIFLAMALKVFKESLNENEEHVEWGILPLLIIALGTSIDALAAGISLGTLPKSYLSALEVGLVTFAICGGAFAASNFLKEFPARRLLQLASMIFFFLGGRIIYNYFF